MLLLLPGTELGADIGVQVRGQVLGNFAGWE